MEWTNPEIVRERGEPERVALNAKTPRYLSQLGGRSGIEGSKSRRCACEGL